MYDLITIGDALVDITLVLDKKNPNWNIDTKKRVISFNYAQKMGIEHSFQSVGGNAANVATGASKLGLKAVIVADIGDDINGHIVLDELDAAGVDVQLISVLPNKETRYSVVINYEAERTILSYHPKRAYRLPMLANTSWIYYTSLGPSFEKLQKQLETYLKKNKDVKFAMNPGSYQLQKGLPHIKRLLSRTDILFVNKEEAELLVGKKATPAQLIRALHKAGVKEVVVTDSTTGSYASNGDEAYSMQIFPTKTLSKAGAGDAYASGYLAARMKEKSLNEAMKWGTANSSGVIQKFGAGEGLLSTSQIGTMIKRHAKITPKPLTI